MKEDLIARVSFDLLEEMKEVLSNDLNKVNCEGIRDLDTSRYIITGFTLKPKDKRRKETTIVLDVNDCRSFDLGHIRRTFGNVLGIEMEMQSVLKNDTIILKNDLQDNDIVNVPTGLSSVDVESGMSSPQSFDEVARTAVLNLLGIKNDTVETLSTASSPHILPFEDLNEVKDEVRDLADEICLVGDINTQTLTFPFVNEQLIDDHCMDTFKNTLFEDFENNLIISGTFTARLVSIFLHKLLSDSIMLTFKDSTNHVLENLPKTIKNEIYDECFNNYLKDIGDEMACKLKFVESWNKCRKEKDVATLCLKLNSNFNQDIVKSTQEFFEVDALSQVNKFSTVYYMPFTQYKMSLSNFLRSNIKARFHTAIKFLYGIQCYNDNEKSCASSSDFFYYTYYTPKNREFIGEITKQLREDKQFELKLSDLFKLWNVDQVQKFIRTSPLINNSKKGDNDKVPSAIIPLSSKITRSTSTEVGSLTRVTYSETTAKNNSKKRKRVYHITRKTPTINKTNICKISADVRDQSYNNKNEKKLVGIMESKEYLFNDVLGTQKYLAKFKNNYLSSSTQFSMFDINMKNSFFDCLQNSSITSDMMNLYLEHVNFILYLIHAQNELPSTCLIFSSIFIEYLLDNQQLISTWDAHLQLCDCKLAFIPIHIQHIDGQVSWNLVVCSLQINGDKSNVDMFLFVSKTCIINTKKMSEITNGIQKWLIHKIKEPELSIHTDIIKMDNENNGYAVIDILTQITFNYRKTESFDVDENISNFIKEINSKNEDCKKIERRIIHVCCEPGTYTELSIFSNGNSQFSFKESIKMMMNNRSRLYQNRTLNYDDIVQVSDESDKDDIDENKDIVDLLDDSDEDDIERNRDEVQSKEVLEVIEEGEAYFPPDMIKSSFQEKLQYLRKLVNEIDD